MSDSGYSIATRPQPGVAGAAVAQAAMALVGEPYRGSGPLRFDWLTLVREAVQAGLGRELMDPERGLLTLDRGLRLGQAADIFRGWGLSPTPLGDLRPGDVLLFAMPAAHGAIIGEAAPGTEPPLIHTYFARACTQSRMGAFWRDRLVGGYRAPQSIAS
jgi:cell wall-associated NlpC family hydrolase